MAEIVGTDPFPPLIESVLLSSSDLFHPDLLHDEQCVLQGGFASGLDLGFDGIDWDISIDDLLLPDCPGSSPADSGLSSSSPVTADESGSMSARSPESGHSANFCTDSGSEVRQESKNSWGVKRKKKQDEEETDNYSLNSRSSKFRRADEIKSCVLNAGSEEEGEKRNARLMRNRESAQLSRQRKKHYVEELEEKVRSIQSTITEMNNKIQFFMAENACLKQQLCGKGGGVPLPGFCAPPAVNPMHFPWIPFPGIAFKPPGSAVPLVPIPKLKPRQSANAGKVKKSEAKKSGGKITKVASISLLGFLFVIMICKCFVPRIGFVFECSSNIQGLGQGKIVYLGDSHGKVLSVSGLTGSMNHIEKVEFNNANGSREDGFDRVTNRSSYVKQTGLEEKLLRFDNHSYSENSSEILPAFLFVSRNGKHVKINGNLIINSVLASEKEAAQANFRSRDVKSVSEENIDIFFESPGNMASALALSKSENGINRHLKSHGSSVENQSIVSSNSDDASKEASLDGPLQQWFREGLAGPIFRSGTCTEVFQYEISPNSGIIHTSSAANATKSPGTNSTESLPASSARSRKKSRRLLRPRDIPFVVKSKHNESERLGEAGPKSGEFPSNKSASAAPMIVSILADPREIGDGDVDDMISPKKSLSRIFVVVLLDSVKYVTYSCVLPFMSPGSHLVN